MTSARPRAPARMFCQSQFVYLPPSLSGQGRLPLPTVGRLSWTLRAGGGDRLGEDDDVGTSGAESE